MSIEFRPNERYKSAELSDLYINGQYAHRWVYRDAYGKWGASMFFSVEQTHKTYDFDTEQEAKDYLIASLVNERIDRARQQTH